MLSTLKRLLRHLPVPLSTNHRYDLLTKKIIRQYCQQASNCVDAGAHEGEVLSWFLRYAPLGKHFAFEPIPSFYQSLKQRYNNCAVFPVALSNKKGSSSFNFVVSNPAYSGLRKRKYDRKKEKDTIIEVETDTLDHLVPATTRIDFIKIDVEGGEMDVLRGATRILSTDHPLVVFEFGIGGSDVYGTTPEEMYSFLASFHYQVSLLNDFLKNLAPLTLENFTREFYHQKNYYFIAH